MRSSVNTVLSTFEGPLAMVEDDTWQLPHRIITDVLILSDHDHTRHAHTRVRGDEESKEERKKSTLLQLVANLERATSDHYDTSSLRETTVSSHRSWRIVSSLSLSLAFSIKIIAIIRTVVAKFYDIATWKCFFDSSFRQCVTSLANLDRTCSSISRG